jgi:hypothetical protein
MNDSEVHPLIEFMSVTNSSIDNITDLAILSQMAVLPSGTVSPFVAKLGGSNHCDRCSGAGLAPSAAHHCPRFGLRRSTLCLQLSEWRTAQHCVIGAAESPGACCFCKCSGQGCFENNLSLRFCCL